MPSPRPVSSEVTLQHHAVPVAHLTQLQKSSRVRFDTPPLGCSQLLPQHIGIDAAFSLFVSLCKLLASQAEPELPATMLSMCHPDRPFYNGKPKAQNGTVSHEKSSYVRQDSRSLDLISLLSHTVQRPS